MQRITLFALLFSVIMGTFAAMAPASADKHKDNFQRRCNGTKAC